MLLAHFPRSYEAAMTAYCNTRAPVCGDKPVDLYRPELLGLHISAHLPYTKCGGS